LSGAINRNAQKDHRNDCHGELIWSQPTEGTMAAHFDLTGTSNRPVYHSVARSAGARGAGGRDPAIGRKAPVKMVSPQDRIRTSGDIPNLVPKPRGAAICSFSIPLITIVASFVFRLFLRLSFIVSTLVDAGIAILYPRAFR